MFSLSRHCYRGQWCFWEMLGYFTGPGNYAYRAAANGLDGMIDRPGIEH